MVPVLDGSPGERGCRKLRWWGFPRGTWLNVCACAAEVAIASHATASGPLTWFKAQWGDSRLGESKALSAIPRCTAGGLKTVPLRSTLFWTAVRGEMRQAIRPVPAPAGRGRLGAWKNCALICDRQGTHAPGPRMSADAGSWEGPGSFFGTDRARFKGKLRHLRCGRLG